MSMQIPQNPQTSNPQLSNPQSNPSSSTFASIQLSDAMIKLQLYVQKLSQLQQLSSSQPEIQEKCAKLLRLSYESFLKYCENQQFAKNSYQLVKSYTLNKKSYYSLYFLDLMLKNSKYVIKQAKKQLETMMKIVWEKVWTEYDNQEKIQNLKIIIKCWGIIYSQKMQENLRKWLDSKYNIKRIQLKQENQKTLREIYGDKFSGEFGKGLKDKTPKFNEALINSLIEDDDQNTNNLGSFTNLLASQRQNSTGTSANNQNYTNYSYTYTNPYNNPNHNSYNPYNSHYNNPPSNNLFPSSHSRNDNRRQIQKQLSIPPPPQILAKKSSSSLGINQGQPYSVPQNTINSGSINKKKEQSDSTNKKIKLEGVSKGLLEALDLD